MNISSWKSQWTSNKDQFPRASNFIQAYLHRWAILDYLFLQTKLLARVYRPGIWRDFALQSQGSWETGSCMQRWLHVCRAWSELSSSDFLSFSTFQQYLGPSSGAHVTFEVFYHLAPLCQVNFDNHRCHIKICEFLFESLTSC